MNITLSDGFYFDLSDGMNWRLMGRDVRKRGMPAGVCGYYGDAEQARGGAQRATGKSLPSLDVVAGREVVEALVSLGMADDSPKPRRAGFSIHFRREYAVVECDEMNWQAIYPIGGETYHATLFRAMRSILWDGVMRQEKTVSWGDMEAEIASVAASVLMTGTVVATAARHNAKPERDTASVGNA